MIPCLDNHKRVNRHDHRLCQRSCIVVLLSSQLVWVHIFLCCCRTIFTSSTRPRLWVAAWTSSPPGGIGGGGGKNHWQRIPHELLPHPIPPSSLPPFAGRREGDQQSRFRSPRERRNCDRCIDPAIAMIEAVGWAWEEGRQRRRRPR